MSSPSLEALSDEADLIGLDPGVIRRIRQTIACRDADGLPRVAGAGEITEVDGVRVQRMFNGVVVEEGCYFGDLITPIITRLKGVHEPQEEVVVHAILERLKREQDAGGTSAPVAIELGCYWSYYSLWFCQELAGARVVAIEPDPAFLDAGRRNARLNPAGEQITFVAGGIASTSGSTFDFTAESDGITRETAAYDLGSLMGIAGADHVDVLYSDIQGYETAFIEHAADLLAAGAVRFIVMSTHHRSISGSALTHQRALQRLQDLGAHVIAEHTVAESCSGDGLIVVSFDERDRDFVVPISHVRARDSLFGELEYEVDQQAQELLALRAQVEQQQASIAALIAQVARLRGRVHKLKRRNARLSLRAASAEKAAQELRRSTTWRLGRAATAPARLRRRLLANPSGRSRRSA